MTRFGPRLLTNSASFKALVNFNFRNMNGRQSMKQVFWHKFQFVVLTMMLAVATTASYGAVTKSTGSGDWNNPAIWSNGVPTSNSDVIIRSGHVVKYNLNNGPAIHTILINGKLAFAQDRDTTLEVGVIVVHPNENYDVSTACTNHGSHHGVLNPLPELEVGSESRPIPAGVTARIRLKAFSGDNSNCAPGIISHVGAVNIHGAPLTHTWLKLGATAEAGSSTVLLSKPVNWKAGDKIIISGTDREDPARPVGPVYLNGKRKPQTEEFVIQSISADGRTITVNGSLRYKHLGGDSDNDLRGEVANLTRNVVIESSDPNGVRGHTMYHSSGKGSISYAAFNHLGKAGLRGRYPIHFHLVDDSMRGSYVKGVAVYDSDNRWVTIHGANFIVVRDTVGYKSLGHGFFLEDGSEVYNLVDNNLGVQAYMTGKLPNQALAYDGNNGGCYWAANARNFVYNSTFVECDNDDSFILEYAPNYQAMEMDVLMPDGSRQNQDVSLMSGGKIKGLEVHTHFGYGPWISGGHFPENNPLLFEDTKVWNTNYSIDISGANVVFDGVELYDAPYGFYNKFPGPHVVRNAYCEGQKQGWFEHGCFMTYRGGFGFMLYENLRTWDTKMIFRMTAQNEQGSKYDPIQIHARNVKILNPQATIVGKKASWIGTEGDNVRSNPLLMLTIHDVFGPNEDAVILPQKQSSTQEGVPAGLAFQDGSSVVDPDGINFEGRGAMKVARANVPFPDNHPLMLPPVDEIPPATSILYPQPGAFANSVDGTLTVRGVSLDQHPLDSVIVNGQPANINENGVDWEITLANIAEGPLTITASASDDHGNNEVNPHTIQVVVADCKSDCLPPELDPDTIPPSVPASLTVFPESESEIRVSWSASRDPFDASQITSGIAGYEIYRDGVKIGEAPGTSYVDSGLLSQKEYSYAVAAFDSAGNRSALTATVSSKTRVEVPALSNDFQWDVLDVGKPVYVDRSYVYQDIADFRGLDYIKTANGQKQSTGNDLFSFQTVSSATVFVGYDQRNSSLPGWLSDWENTGKTLNTNDTNFNVLSRTFDAGSTVNLGGNGSSANSMYVVVVKFGDDLPPPVPPSDTTPPSVPENFNASAVSETTVKVTWSPSTDDTGVAGYSVLRDGVEIGLTQELSYTDNGLIAGETYSYQIAVSDEAGNNAATAPIEVTTPIAAPDLPPVLSNNYQWSRLEVGQSAYIDRSYVYTDVAEYGGLDYIMTANDDKRSKDGDVVVSFQTPVPSTVYIGFDLRIGSLPSWLSGWEATGKVIKTDDASFQVLSRVFAAGSTVELGGNAGSGQSSMYVIAVAFGNNLPPVPEPEPEPTDTTAPSVPGNFNARAVSETTVSLTWDHSTDDFGVSGYKVLGDGNVIATTQNHIYSDTSLSAGKTRSYQVIAFDAAGNSASTDTIEVTTPVPVPVPDLPPTLSNGYQWGGELQVGQPVYIDRSYVYQDVAGYAGLDYIMTANGDKRSKDEVVVSFETPVPATVYLGLDTRIATPPSWLKGWETTGVVLKTNDATFRVFSHSYTAGSTVNLGGNGGSGSSSTYVVAVAFGNATLPPEPEPEPQPVDTTAPSVPGNFKAWAVSETTVSMTWSPSTDDTGVSSYTVFRDGVAVGTTRELSYSVSGMTAGEKHNYQVSASDEAGNQSVTEAIEVATMAPVSDTPPKLSNNYQWGKLDVGQPVFIDRGYVYQNIGDFEGMDYIQTANNDKQSKTNELFSFKIPAQATVYVGVDKRIATPPSWLGDWNNIGKEIQSSDATYVVYAKTYAACSTVSLGGNYGNPGQSMYMVAIEY